MKWNAYLIVAASVCLLGCSGTPPRKDQPVSVSGKVTSGGRPLGGIMVSFQPLDNGHVGNLPVSADGTFTGQLIAGNYAYYVGKSSTPTSTAALRKVDPKFHEPDLSRSIAIESGKEIVLALD